MTEREDREIIGEAGRRASELSRVSLNLGSPDTSGKYSVSTVSGKFSLPFDADVVVGTSHLSTGVGVFGNNTSSKKAKAPAGSGVLGFTVAEGAAGVFGSNNTTSGKGVGVQGNGPERGVSGFSQNVCGVAGQSEVGSGVLATSRNGQGVTALSENDVGLFSQGGFWAGVFSGAIVVGKGPDPTNSSISPNKNTVNGSIVINDGGSLFLNGGGDIVLGNADCAEDFDLSRVAEGGPGSVMVLDADGTLCECTKAYDKRVVGVVSGAGEYRPGLVLDRHPGKEGRAPLALLGKVYCQVDADYASIEVGDPLTSSPTPGHAMKAIDAQKSFGAVIGKALRASECGRSLIPILVALQ